MFRRLIAAWLLACLLIPSLVHGADVTANLDRNRVQLGETVTLNVRVNGRAGNVDAPDLGALNRDFQVLGTSQSSNLSIVNGTASSAVTFGIALRPRHTGSLQIPALSVAGSQTAPLQLQVDAPDPATAAATGKDVFMEAQVEPAHGYVGQQLSYVVRLYYAINISNGALNAPQVDGAEVSQVGSDRNYADQRGDRDYHVLERRYALVPQRAGHLDIPAMDFQGAAIDPNDPNSFFGASTPVSASAPALAIDVQAPPADWGKSAWLPARQLTLTLDGLPTAQDSPRVGQPLNLTMRLEATGLSYEVLPALSLPPLDGATVYPDKPATGNRQDGQWTSGWRQQAFAIVPERAGTLTIPATTLKWWNVLTDRMEVAQIPAHSITVLPAVGAVAAPPAAAAAAPAAGGTGVAPAATARSPMPWRWVALASIGLWLLSMLAWWLWRRRAATVVPTAPVATRTSARQCQLAFLAAARGSDVAAQVHSLLAWARAERPAIQHLGELAAALGDEPQRAAIAALQQRHYANASITEGGAVLVEVFRRGFVWRSAGAAGVDASLPPLYPFKLH
ncbi:MAG: BatD family protein [Rhodanobacter sp.]